MFYVTGMCISALHLLRRTLVRSDYYWANTGLKIALCCLHCISNTLSMINATNFGQHSSFGGAVNEIRVEHRYIARGWYTPTGATALLLGTFPSVLIREAFGRVRQTDVDFFYGSNDNNFWKDLSLIYQTPLLYARTEEAVQQRMHLLDTLKLALSDAIFACTTTGSAMDTALQNIELNEGIIKTLDANDTITTLYFTSSSGKVNAESLTLRLLKEKSRLTQMKIIQQSRPRRRQFLYTNAQGVRRMMHTVTLISPSPLAEQMAGISPHQRRELYQTWLPKMV